MSRYRWKEVGGDDDRPEYAETTTGGLGYHRSGESWQDTAQAVVGSREFPWLCDFKMRTGVYCFVGAFGTAREARGAVILAYENHWCVDRKKAGPA